MERRNFLGLLIPAIIISPLIEIPRGREFISFSGIKLLTESEIIALELERIKDKLPKLFFFHDSQRAFFETCVKETVYIRTVDMRIPFK